MKTFRKIAVTIRTCLFTLCLCFAALFCPLAYAENAYSNLISLFDDWREFERPPFKNGAPDYTANTFEVRYKKLHNFKTRLNKPSKSYLCHSGSGRFASENTPDSFPIKFLPSIYRIVAIKIKTSPDSKSWARCVYIQSIIFRCLVKTC